MAVRTLGLSEMDAAVRTWHIGICSIFLSGIFKVGCAFVSGLVHRAVPAPDCWDP